MEKHGGGRFHAYSAGSKPIAEPNAEVMAKLQALGHDTHKLRSKSWSEFTGPSAPRMDFVITLCDTPDGAGVPGIQRRGGHSRMAAAGPGEIHRQFASSGRHFSMSFTRACGGGSIFSRRFHSPLSIAWR